jgi:hypothetical protein
MKLSFEHEMLLGKHDPSPLTLILLLLLYIIKMHFQEASCFVRNELKNTTLLRKNVVHVI